MNNIKIFKHYQLFIILQLKKIFIHFGVNITLLKFLSQKFNIRYINIVFIRTKSGPNLP